MSATQPALLSGALELAGNKAEVAAIFSAFNRYQLNFGHRETRNLDDFIAGLLPRLTDRAASVNYTEYSCISESRLEASRSQFNDGYSGLLIALM